jgi:hypothetical protein
MAPEMRDFWKVRTRFHRLGEGLVRTGWVQTLENPTLIVATLKDASFQADDKFHFEVFGRERNVGFDAVISSPSPYWASADAPLDGEEAWYEFRVCSDLRYSSPKEDYRKCVPVLPARIWTDSGEHTASLVDISRHGAGLLVNQKLRIGDQVRVELRIHGYILIVNGTVRYSRCYRSAHPNYRTGIRLLALEKQEQEHWEEILKAA